MEYEGLILAEVHCNDRDNLLILVTAQSQSEVLEKARKVLGSDFDKAFIQIEFLGEIDA